MKKTLKGLMLALVLVLGLVLVGCDLFGPQVTCEHKNGSWEIEGENHYFACADCQEQVNKGAHTYGEWSVTIPASVGAVGLESRQCSVCKFVEQREIPAIVVATGESEGDFDVYAKVPAEWEITNVYYWNAAGTGNLATEHAVGWPGKAMTLVDAENHIWGFTLPKGVDSVIFNNGSVQTADLLFATELNLYDLSAQNLNADNKLLADYGTYTPASDQPELNKYETAAPETFRTVYAQVPAEWTAVNVHYWGSAAATDWPGTAMTLVDADKHIYSFELSSTVTGIIFVSIVDGASVDQTANIEGGNIDASINGYVVEPKDGNDGFAPATYADGVFTPVEVEAAPVEFYVKGSMNSWSGNDDYKFSVEGTTATLTITLEKDAEFKMAPRDSWSPEIGFGGLSEVNAELFADNGGNIKCLVAGTYVITITNYNDDARVCTITPAA